VYFDVFADFFFGFFIGFANTFGFTSGIGNCDETKSDHCSPTDSDYCVHDIFSFKFLGAGVAQVHQMPVQVLVEAQVLQTLVLVWPEHQMPVWVWVWLVHQN
jgi:hypothetical protein